MKFVQKEFSCTTEEKKSKFLAFLLPFSNFDDTMQNLRKLHPKAVHFVYAYRYLNEFNQIVENSSDDGEPKGTSGKPCLNALKGAELINSAIIVVRYFGGIKLGTGGLVRAYSGATNSAIDISELIAYKKKEQMNISVEYSDFSKIEYLISLHDILVIEKNFESNCLLTLEATAEVFEELKTKLPINTTLSDAEK